MSRDAVVDLYERHARAYDRVSLARDFAGACPATIRGGVAPQQTEHAQGAVTAPPAGWLQLLTPKSHYFLKPSFGDMPRHRRSMGRPTLEMHPDDATARGLVDGTRVVVRNGQGEVHAWLRATDAVPPEIATRPASDVAVRRTWAATLRYFASLALRGPYAGCLGDAGLMVRGEAESEYRARPDSLTPWRSLPARRSAVCA